MKTIGLIGGISWYSTLDYYRIINEETNRRLGGSEAASLLLASVNYGEIIRLTKAGDWNAIGEKMKTHALAIQDAGADCLLLGANTMHHVADTVESALRIPLLHIADCVARAALQKGINKLALFGTRYTMQFSFYRDRLSRHGIETFLPPSDSIDWINQTIYEEMGKGVFSETTRNTYLELFEQVRSKGAEGIILGCTELPLLIEQKDFRLPLLNTTELHAKAAVEFALSGKW